MAQEDAANCDSCARRPRLALLLWILWLAVAILAGVFFGHGASAQDRRDEPLTVETTAKRAELLQRGRRRKLVLR